MQNLKVIAIVALVVFAIWYVRKEKYAPLEEAPEQQATVDAPTDVILPSDRKGALLKASKSQPTSCSASVNMLAKPKADDGFGQFAPDPSKLRGKNFIDASRWVTIGSMSTRRNINRDLRADVPIPKNNGISPWNQSSIDQQPEGRPLDCP